ncbi:MAG: c-type cytochrome [Pseudomonadaceae bacterium]|nr:c-type cytochrome [Pseudomonadaceae bacterium]
MKSIQNTLQIVVVLTGLCMAQVVCASDEGKDLAWKYHCVTCHGMKGISIDQRYPNLAGQNVAYLVSRLRYFRDGVEHGNQMNGQAAPLSDEEITKISEFFNKPS